MSERQERKVKNKTFAKFSYCFKPKAVMQTPLNKYSLAKLSSEVQDGEITDYFNYGFNCETFPIYSRLCERFAEVHNLVNPLQSYDPNSQKQFRFNDEKPIDLGGFGPFLDKQLIKIWDNGDIETEDSLVQFFVNFNFTIAKTRTQNNPLYSLVQYVRLLNNQNVGFKNPLHSLVQELSDRLVQKYESTIDVLRKKQQNSKKKDIQSKSEKKSDNIYDIIFADKLGKPQIVKEEIKETLSQNQSQSNSSISYSSIDSYNGQKQQIQKSQIKLQNNSSQKRQLIKKTKRWIKEQQDSEQQIKSKKQKNKRKYHSKKSKSKKIKHKGHKKHKKHGKKSKKHKK